MASKQNRRASLLVEELERRDVPSGWLSLDWEPPPAGGAPYPPGTPSTNYAGYGGNGNYYFETTGNAYRAAIPSPNTTYFSYLSPAQPQEANGFSAAEMQVLERNYNTEFNGWSFSSAADSGLTLDQGTVHVMTYQATAYTVGPVPVIGARIGVTYQPIEDGGGPDPAKGDEIHWIQVVTAHTPNEVGSRFQFPDVTSAFYPYYDYGYTASSSTESSNFWDDPRRAVPANQNIVMNWSATLLLATEDPGTLNVTLWQGLTYGWRTVNIANILTATNYSAQTTTGAAVTTDVVTSDDQIPQGDNPTVSAVGTATDGLVSIVSGDTVRYTPNVGFHGYDSYTFTLSDSATTTQEPFTSLLILRRI